MKKVFLLVRNQPARQSILLPDEFNVEEFAKQHRMEVYESHDKETIQLLETFIADKRESIVNSRYEDAALFRDREWNTVMKQFGIDNKYNYKTSIIVENNMIYLAYLSK